MAASGSRYDSLLICDLKKSISSGGILYLDLYQSDSVNIIKKDSLVISGEDSHHSKRASIDKFFLQCASMKGYFLFNKKIPVGNRDWELVANYLLNCNLVDLKRLLKIIFPTLTQGSISYYRQRFNIDNDISESQTAFTLIKYSHLQVHSLPRGLIKIVKKMSASLTGSVGKWIRDTLSESAIVDELPELPLFANLGQFTSLTTETKVSIPDIRDLFEEGSELSNCITGFEYRKGQSRYANVVSRTLDNQEITLLEAATGTGKSIGYLLPLITHCYQNAARAVIATRTKSLQAQLFEYDLQKIKSLIPARFKISILKGLKNYLCLLKYKGLMGELDFSDKEDAETYLSLILWEKETKSGDLSELIVSGEQNREEFLEKFVLDEHSCPGKECPYYEDCYAYSARRKALKSDIVITNYALLLSDIASSANILGRFSYAVFDEAHRLEKTAIDSFSKNIALLTASRDFQKISSFDFFDLLKDILPESYQDQSMFDNLADIGSSLSAKFAELANRLTGLAGSKVLTKERIRIRFDDPLYKILATHYDSEQDNYKILLQICANIKEVIQSGIEAGKPDDITNLKSLVTQVEGYLLAIKKIATNEDHNLVIWARFFRSGEVLVTTAPINVGEILADKLYPRYESIVMTSATLDCEDQFNWIKNRLGLIDENELEAKVLKLASPFLLDEQLFISIARFLPPPSAPVYANRLGKLLQKLRQSIHLPTLVLCTSYAMIETISQILSADRNLPGELLTQSSGSSPQTLLAKFKLADNPILIGTETFWEGVDLPGEELRLLILTRLPFPVPDDPLEQAKGELAEAEGNNPFMTVSLPSAVLKFRQGMGRVIRNASDWGAVVITDSRIARKNYGRIFYEASPVVPNIHDQESILVRETAKWLYQFK